MSSRAKQDPRRVLKKGIDSEEGRKKREEASNTLRKNKREEGLQKKRNVFLVSEEVADVTVLAKPVVVSKIVDIPEYVVMINAQDPATILQGVTHFRKLLSIEKNPPISTVIESGVVPRLIQLLMHTQQNIQFESAWAITNIASGDSIHTKAVVDFGAIPPLIQLLSHQSEELREQAVWAVGNIAGDCAKLRDNCLNAGAMNEVLKQFVNTAGLSMIRNATWTLSNLCRGKPAPKFEIVGACLPLLSELLKTQDEEVLVDACWTLSYLSDGDDTKIQAVINIGVIPRLVELMMHHSHKLQTPALRTIGNIVTGDDMQTQAVLNYNALSPILSMLGSPKKNLRKEACWTVSNITAGNVNQIQAILDANMVPSLIERLTSDDFDVKREACWAISNACSGGNQNQVRYLVQQGCIKPICDMLDCRDSKLILVALETVENILKFGVDAKTQENVFANFVEQADGLEKIEDLQRHDNNDIYQKAVQILETYYAAEEVENENPAPNANTFSFGATAYPQTGFSF